MPLTDTAIRNAKPEAKDRKLADGGGLYLFVTAKGGKLWRLKYRYDGKEKLLAFGSYPEISLADARQRREDARKLIANGVDPGEVKKAQKAATVAVTENSFEVVAREWHSKFSGSWSACHAETTLGRLQLDVFPALGAKSIEEIKAMELLAMTEAEHNSLGIIEVNGPQGDSNAEFL
jgi:hypothetical protein